MLSDLMEYPMHCSPLVRPGFENMTVRVPYAIPMALPAQQVSASLNIYNRCVITHQRPHLHNFAPIFMLCMYGVCVNIIALQTY